MANIKAKGDFDLSVINLPTFRKVKGIFNGGEVTVDFDKIEMSYNGEVRVLVIEFNKYIKPSLVIPSTGEEVYFEFILKELDKLSVARAKEIKRQRKFAKN